MRRIELMALSLFLASWTASLTGQEPTKPPETEDKVLRIPPPGRDNAFRRSGAEIPKYMVVTSFFDHAFEEYSRGEKIWNVFAAQLNMTHDTEAHWSLERAMFLAKAVKADRINLLEHKDKKPEEFMRIQLAVTRRQVQSMKGIYRTFLEEMDRFGVGRETIEAFMEERIRPDIEVVSFPTPDFEYFEVLHEFDSPKGQLQ